MVPALVYIDVMLGCGRGPAVQSSPLTALSSQLSATPPSTLMSDEHKHSAVTTS